MGGLSRDEHIEAIIYRREESISKDDNGIIQDVKSVQDLIDNEKSREYSKELVRLRRFCALLKENAN